MTNMFRDVVEFHEKFDLPNPSRPCKLDDETSRFRVRFMTEELVEYTSAVRQQDLEGQLDALVDLVYVALGTAHMHGFDFNEAWRRVHAANMKKVRAEKASDSKRGTALDVVKPEGWIAPDLKDLVA